MSVIETLCESDEPGVRYRVCVNVLGEDPQSESIRELREEIRTSPRAAGLLSERGADGTIPFHPYSKWYGSHWVLVALAEIGYPPGNDDLRPMAEQVLQCWLSERHLKSIPQIEGRTRQHCSQEGNAVYALLTLGLDDPRIDQLAANLRKWQWPDGGWNCDKRPAAHVSSFHESIHAFRAMALYGRVRGCTESLATAQRAAEVFLTRKLFRRLRDGKVMKTSFLKLHYPRYWHYDILFGLKVIAEAGFIGDPRCGEALDYVESRRLEDGGFGADAKYYFLHDKRMKSGNRHPGRSFVDWGGTSKRKMNPWVTADALAVLKEAGRFEAKKNLCHKGH